MRHVKQVLATFAIGLPLLVWAAANAGAPVAAAGPAAVGSAGAGTHVAQADPNAALPDGPGKDITIKTCTKCHSITNVTGQHKTKDAWTDTITKMVGYGASGSDDDFLAILDYVNKYYGTEPPPPAPPASK